MMGSQPDLGPVLVIGGCGFLGHRIVQQLHQDRLSGSIHVLDIRTDRNRLADVTYFDGDITSRKDVESIISQSKAQVIFHTASPPAVAHNLTFFTKINVEGTRTLLECAQAADTVIAFVYTSSASVIHDSISDLVNGDENAPLMFMPAQKAAYSHTKALAESLVLAANRSNGRMLTTAIRPSGLFGEDDPTTVKPMVEAAASGKYKYQVGNGKTLFDWCYVGNAVQAHLLAAQALLRAHGSSTETPANGNVAGEAFLITNDEPVPFWEFARKIGAAAGYPTKIDEVRVIPRIVGLAMATISEWFVWATSFGRRKSSMTRQGIKFSTMTRTFRIEKAKRVLKYKPLVRMEEGIRLAGQSFARTSKKQN